MITIFQLACNDSENRAGPLCYDPLPESHTKLVSQDNGGGSADHCKPICGSPKLSPSVYEKGVVKGSINQNVPVSEVVDLDVGNASSNSHDTKGHDASKDGISGSFDVSSLAELSKGDAGKNWPSIPPMVAPKVSTVNFSVAPVYTIPNIFEVDSCPRCLSEMEIRQI